MKNLIVLIFPLLLGACAEQNSVFLYENESVSVFEDIKIQVRDQGEKQVILMAQLEGETLHVATLSYPKNIDKSLRYRINSHASVEGTYSAGQRVRYERSDGVMVDTTLGEDIYIFRNGELSFYSENEAVYHAELCRRGNDKCVGERRIEGEFHTD